MCEGIVLSAVNFIPEIESVNASRSQCSCRLVIGAFEQSVG